MIVKEKKLMELYAEILSAALQYSKVEVSFPGGASLQDVVEGQCYAAICKIRQIIADPALDDPDCFRKIEEIVSALNAFGIDTGSRHDF